MAAAAVTRSRRVNMVYASFRLQELCHCVMCTGAVTGTQTWHSHVAPPGMSQSCHQAHANSVISCMKHRCNQTNMSCHVMYSVHGRHLHRQQLHLAIIVDRLLEGSHQNLLGCVCVRKKTGSSCQLKTHLQTAYALVSKCQMPDCLSEDHTWEVAGVQSKQASYICIRISLVLHTTYNWILFSSMLAACLIAIQELHTIPL